MNCHCEESRILSSTLKVSDLKGGTTKQSLEDVALLLVDRNDKVKFLSAFAIVEVMNHQVLYLQSRGHSFLTTIAEEKHGL